MGEGLSLGICTAVVVSSTLDLQAAMCMPGICYSHSLIIIPANMSSLSSMDPNSKGQPHRPNIVVFNGPLNKALGTRVVMLCCSPPPSTSCDVIFDAPGSAVHAQVRCFQKITGNFVHHNQDMKLPRVIGLDHDSLLQLA